MKNVFTVIVSVASFFVLISLTSKVQAQETAENKEAGFYSDFYVMQVKPMMFKMTYNYPVTDRVRVRIFDGNKNLLFGENALVYKKYHKIFDLSIFNDGQYTFELLDGEKEYKQSFNITTRTTRTVTAQNQ